MRFVIPAVVLVLVGMTLGSVGDDAWAQAFWTFNGEPVCIHLFEQRIPTAVSDGLGGAIIAWQTNRYGEWDIHAQRMSCEGDRLWQPWEPQGVWVCAFVGDAMNPRMVSDNAGGAIVTWEDYRDQAVTGVDIHAQRLDQDGNRPWNPGGFPIGRPVCVEEYDQLYPAMATDMAEGVIIAWSDGRASTGESDIWAQRIALDDGMRLWPPEGKPICTAAGEQILPAMVADATGGAIITWCDFRNGSEFEGDIYAQRVDVNGNPLWPLDGVWIGQVKFWHANFNFAGPKIISDDVGGAIIVWMGPAPDTWNAVYAQRINPGGYPQWAEGGVRVDPPGIESRDKRWPAVTTDHMSGAVVAWTNVLAAGEYDIIQSEIWAERVKLDGTLLWGGVPVRMSDHPDWQSNVYPGIASDGEGGAIVTWKDDRRKMEWWPRHYYDLYAQWLDENGNCIWQSKGVPVDTGYYRTESQRDIFHYWSEHVVTDEANGAVITWASDRADPYRPVWDIYAQRVSGKLVFGSTQYPNGRKLSRIPGTDDLWVAYEYSGRVYAGLSADAGKRWQTWYLGDLSDDGFPTIAVAPPSEQAPMPLPFPVVVWMQPGSGSDPPALRCARFWVENDAWQIGSLYYQSSHTPYLPSIVIDDGRIAHLTWEMVTSNQRYLHYGTFQTDDPEVWPPVFFHDPPLDNEPGLDWFMAPCIALNQLQDPLEPNIVYKKGDGIYYKVKEGGVWSAAQLISQTDRTASFPFLEIYGDSIQALWHAYKPSSSDDDEVWYRSKHVYDPWWYNEWVPVSETSSFESQFPCMAADYASWSEEWDSPGDNWEIVMREKPFDESFDNISQTVGALSMWSHVNYWQRLTETDRLFFAWTEGTAPCTVKVKEWQLGHPPVAYLYVETGQEEPSFYCVDRDSFVQFGPEPYQQVDIDADQLIYRLPGLMPWMRYQLVVTGYWEGEGELRERLDIDGLAEQLIKLEAGVAETLTIWIPPAAYRDDKEVDVTLTLVSGDWALTGPMIVYQFEREEGEGGPQVATPSHVEPNDIVLYQNFPNPVSRQTTISYQLPANGRLSLKIYDTTGRPVATLVDKPTEMGYHRVRWDGKDDSGRMVANGVYFYRLEAAGLTSTKKLVMLR